jgi:hypothetical protein
VDLAEKLRHQIVVQPLSIPYLFPSSQDKSPYEGPGTWSSLRVFVRKFPYLELMDPNLVTKKEVETPFCPVSHGHDLGAEGQSFSLWGGESCQPGYTRTSHQTSEESRQTVDSVGAEIPPMMVPGTQKALD